MAFLPIDLQVSFQQVASVADQAAAEKEGPERAREKKGRDLVDKKEKEENIIEEDQDIKTDQAEGESGRGGAAGGNFREEEEQSSSEPSQSKSSHEPGKGKFLDLKT